VSNWTVAGYPIAGIWAKAITGWNDKNGDGILTVDESHDRLGHDVRQQHRPGDGQAEHSVIGVGTFRGYAEPRYLTTLTSGIDLFNHKLRIQNLFDWRGGNRYYNKHGAHPLHHARTATACSTRPHRSKNRRWTWRRIYAPEKTLDGYMQPGAFVKWREAR